MASPTPFVVRPMALKQLKLFFLIPRLCQPIFLDTICHLSSNQPQSWSKLSLQFRQIIKSLCVLHTLLAFLFSHFIHLALSVGPAISTIFRWISARVYTFVSCFSHSRKALKLSAQVVLTGQPADLELLWKNLACRSFDNAFQPPLSCWNLGNLPFKPTHCLSLFIRHAWKLFKCIGSVQTSHQSKRPGLCGSSVHSFSK